MQVANICPTSLLMLVLDSKSTYHLVLASQVLKDPAYARFYRDCSERGDTVILDNDAHEIGTSIDPYQLASAALLVSPTTIVLPDKLKASGKVSFQLALDGLDKLRYNADQFMAVPHGDTIEDYLNCALNLARIPQVTSLGIYRLNIDHDISREVIIRQLSELPVAFHLLGAGPNFRELSSPFLRWRCSGVDTAKFVQAGLEGKRLRMGSPPIERNRRDPSYFSASYRDANTRLICDNIEYWRNICS